MKWNLPIRATVWKFKFETSRHVFHKPLAEWYMLWLSGRPQVSRYYYKCTSGADSLWAFAFSKAQYFGEPRLGFGNGPNPLRN